MRSARLTPLLIAFEAAVLLLAACDSNVAQPTVTPSLVADSTILPSQTQTTPIISAVTPSPTSTPTPRPQCQEAAATTEWRVYTNTAIGFSIDYPSWFNLTTETTSNFGYIGDKVFFQVIDQNPLDCRGDCPVIMVIEPDVTVAGMEATKIKGYIGEIGGNVPQEYLKYVFDRGGDYYVFTLKARCRYDSQYSPDGIWPLEEDDIALFNQMISTARFGN